MERGILKYCLFAAFLAVMLVIPVEGRSGEEPTVFFEHFDSDGDGKVSVDEFPGSIDHFNQMDSDGDGYISASEAPQGPPADAPPRGKGGGFDNDDADQDGRVSLEEFSGPEEMFNDMDTDGDGYITRSELPVGPPKGKAGPAPDEDW